MDRQAMDRAHRIGQTRDVHIFRLISEKTVEENIWRKQVIKRKLDDMVIDQGEFSREEARFWNRMARQEGVKGGEGENIFGGGVGGDSGEEADDAGGMSMSMMSGKGNLGKGKGMSKGKDGKGYETGADKGKDGKGKGKGKNGKGGKAGSKGGFFFSSVSEETDEMFFGTQVLHGMSDDLMGEAGIGVTVGHSGAPAGGVSITDVTDQNLKSGKLETIPEGTTAAGSGQISQESESTKVSAKLSAEEQKQLEALKKLEARKKASREMESAMRMLEDDEDYQGFREAANEEEVLITGTGEHDGQTAEEGGKDGKDGNTEIERKLREREEREELARIAGKGKKVVGKGRKKSDLGRKKSDEKKKAKNMDVDSGTDIDEDDSAFSSEELMEGSDAERTGKAKTDKVKRTPGLPSILPSIYKAHRRNHGKKIPPMSLLTRKRRLRRVLNTIKNCAHWSKQQHKLWKKRRQNRRLKWLAFLKARKAKNTTLGTNNTPLVDYCLGQARRLDLMLSSIKPKAKRKGRKPKKIRGRLAPIPEGSDSQAPKLTERQEKLKLLSETFRERTLCITRCRGTFRIDDSLRRSRANRRRTSVDGNRGGGMDTQSNTAYNTALNSVSTPFLTSGKREGKHQFGAHSTFGIGSSSGGSSAGKITDSGSKGADWARTHLPSFKETEAVPFLERTSTGASAKSSKSMGSANSQRNFKSPPGGNSKDAKWLQNSGLKESDGDSGVRKRVRFRDEDSPEADSASGETGSAGRKEKSKGGKKEKSMRRSSTGSAKNQNLEKKSKGAKPKSRSRKNSASASSPDPSDQASSSAASNTNTNTNSSNSSGPNSSGSSQNSSGHLSLASINSSNISGLSLQSLSSMSLGDRIKLRNRYLGQDSIRNRTRSRTKSRESEEGHGGE